VLDTFSHGITGLLRLEGTSGGRLVQPHAQARSLEQVALGHVHQSFEYLQGGRLCSLSGQLVPVFNNTHGKKISADD